MMVVSEATHSSTGSFECACVTSAYSPVKAWFLIARRRGQLAFKHLEVTI